MEGVITKLKHLRRLNKGDGGGTRDWQGTEGTGNDILNSLEIKQSRNSKTRI